MEGPLNGRHQHHHTHQAVDHRGNTGQQLHGGVNHPGDLGRRHLSQKDGGQNPQRDTDNHGAGCAIDTGEDKGQNAKILRTRRPLLTKQEIDGANLHDGGQARDNQVDTDEQHKAHREDSADQEEDVYSSFQGVDL